MTDRNPYTDEEREEIRERYRGRILPNGMARNFCGGCGVPMEVPQDVALDKSLLCDECSDDRLPAYVRSFNHGAAGYSRHMEEV